MNFPELPVLRLRCASLRMTIFGINFAEPNAQNEYLGELFEEAHVAGVEVADVGDAVLDHGDALDAHAESEAGDLFRVVGIV
jgi:hypothetical protein